MSDLEGEEEELQWRRRESFSISYPEDFLGFFPDLVFVCFDGSVEAHRAVLGPLSSMLHPLLSPGIPQTVLLPDFDCEDMNHLLNILYTGRATCSEERAERLQSLTKTLKMDPIPISYSKLGKSFCEFSSQKKSSSRNVKYGDQGVRNVVKKEMNEELVQRVLSKTVSKNSPQQEVSARGFENNCRASDDDLKLCYICRALVRGHNIFLEHLRLHRDEGGPYPCPEQDCSSKESTGLVLHRHYIEHHLVHQKIETSNNDNKEEQENEKYKCDMCCFSWINFSHFKVHMNEVHSIRPLKCNHCDQRFNDKLGLNTHVQAKHTTGSNYPCDVCNKKFKTGRFLYYHRRQIHELGDSRAAKCETCGFVSKGLANLKKHIKTVHNMEMSKHQCSYCPSMFKSKYNLTCHERTHSGEAPYQCKYCANKFKRAHHLKGHLEICKKNTDNIGVRSLENVELLVDK